MTNQKIIKQIISNNIANKEQIRLVAKAQPLKSHLQVKRWTFAMITCLLIISFCLGGLHLFNIQHKDGYFSFSNMLSDGKLLYIRGSGDVNLISYDPVSKEMNSLISITDEIIYEIYVNENYFFYSCESGVYFKNRKTSEKISVIEYGKEIPGRLKEYEGLSLLNTSAIEGSIEFLEHDGSIYFSYYTEIDLMPEEHHVTGIQKWIKLYCFDIKTKRLTLIKQNYYVGWHDNINIKDLTIIQDKIYYRNYTEVHRLSFDGKQDDVIYNVPSGQICRLDWAQDKFYCIEQIEEDLAAPIELKQDPGCFFSVIDLNGNKLFSNKNIYNENFDWHGMGFDDQTDTYIAGYNDELIRFSFEQPAKYIKIAQIETVQDTVGIVDIVIIDSSIFISAYDRTGRINDHYIMTIENGKMIIIIKNGELYTSKDASNDSL